MSRAGRGGLLAGGGLPPGDGSIPTGNLPLGGGAGPLGIRSPLRAGPLRSARPIYGTRERGRPVTPWHAPILPSLGTSHRHSGPARPATVLVATTATTATVPATAATTTVATPTAPARAITTATMDTTTPFRTAPRSTR